MTEPPDQCPVPPDPLDECVRLRAEVKRLEAIEEENWEKLVAYENCCACSLDEPGDVCAGHSPMLDRAKAECGRMKPVVDAAVAWGGTDADDVHAMCAAELTLSNALIDYRKSRDAKENDNDT
jgi:hypothetical protein